ncbi:hypothetical protein BST81_05240 [Leptolyngbya sp. 'hensonii']|uniref:C39 family peptidase n=1 Tax=Leptolyngbya sp. 'hensonii' TaxID=1922337 RepID=UPI00094FF769|nr:C39 family peptidase [Leptolyngbya sp. 'hensonii']OLP19476.1 hypothetical protein BST81_05240 [Leptolyngbya sp. 'hensonii']
MPEYVLQIVQDTVLKQQPIPSDQIKDQNHKEEVRAGSRYRLHSFAYDQTRQHFKVAFLLDRFKEKNTWWVYADHVDVFKDGVLLPEGRSMSVRLKVPYLSQLDNAYNPYEACNITAVAMCLTYLGLKPSQPQVQLEDELYKYCELRGLSRHDPRDLAHLIRTYGYQDDFQSRALWEEVKLWLVKGYPAIVHGYFTRFGHVVVIIGYDDRGWIVHDPYGEWLETGYDTNASGAGLTYPYALMQRLCGPDASGELWVHYIRK